MSPPPTTDEQSTVLLADVQQHRTAVTPSPVNTPICDGAANDSAISDARPAAYSPGLPTSRIQQVEVERVEPFRITLPLSHLPSDIVRHIIRPMATTTPLQAIEALLCQLSMEELSELVGIIRRYRVIIPQWWIPSDNIDHVNWRMAVDNWDAVHHFMSLPEDHDNDLMHTLNVLEELLELEPRENGEEPEGGRVEHDQ